MIKILLMVILTGIATAQPPGLKPETVVEYLCCDWGPAMTLPAEPGEKPCYSETEDEVYFLKQIHVFTPPAKNVPGKRTTSLYLCKMKADGTAKMEIRELRHDVKYPIDTQGLSTWMDVNEKTKRIAVSIGFAGSDLVGLWVMNMDGTGLTRIVTESTEESQLRAINTCSWTPDGKWIVFEEELRGTKPHNFHNIVRCDATGGQFRRLLLGGEGGYYLQPSVSPDGKMIAFVKMIAVEKTSEGYRGERWIWLMNVDGTEARPLGGKQSHNTWGNHPAWSPDGSKIIYTGGGRMMADVASGRVLQAVALKGEGTWGWPHWGRNGIVGYAVRGILSTDSDFQESKLIGKPTRLEGVGEQW